MLAVTEKMFLAGQLSLFSWQQDQLFSPPIPFSLKELKYISQSLEEE